MPMSVSRIVHKLRTDPGGIPAAVIRRVRPRSARYGFPWVRLPDGSITFRERGFVEASSPSLLLARHHHEVQCIRKALAGRHAAASLEIGCGFGRLSPTFAEFSDRHVAVDINDDALAAARGAYPGIRFLRAAAQALPFPDASFGLVTTWTVLQHVAAERLPAAVAEIVRVLAPGGVLLLCEETRAPGERSAHCWHRPVARYAELFAPLRLRAHGPIEALDRLPGSVSPGEVMVFEAAPAVAHHSADREELTSSVDPLTRGAGQRSVREEGD